MGRAISYFKSTIGQKVIVATSGLSLSLFCFGHMAGNLLLIKGAEAYNRYAYAMITNPLLIPVELVLLLIFFMHLAVALRINYNNRAAKGMRSVANAKNKGSSFAARTMVYSGLLLLVFVILHLVTFKYGPHYTISYDGIEMRDLYKLVVEKFKQPLYLVYYVFSMIVLGLHLSHGLKGSLQSLGFLSSQNKLLTKISWAITLTIAGGFSAQPIYLFFFGG